MPPFPTARDQNPAIEQSQVASQPGDNAEPVPFWTAAKDGFDSYWNTQRSFSREQRLQQDLFDRQRAITQATGQELPRSFDMMGLRPVEAEVGGGKFNLEGGLYWGHMLHRQFGRMTGRILDDNDYEQKVEELRAKFPDKMAAIPTRQQLMARIGGDLEAKQQRVALDAASGPGGQAGAFVGGAGGTMVDPTNLSLMAMTGGGSSLFEGTALAANSVQAASRPLIAKVLASSARGAIANTAFQGAQAPFQVADSQVVGPQYTWGDAGNDELGAFAGGAVLGPIFDAVGHGSKAGVGKLRQVLGAGVADDTARGALEAADTLHRDEAALGHVDGATFDEARTGLVVGAPKPSYAPERDISTLFDPDRVATPRNLAQPDEGPAAILSATEYRGRPIYAGSFDPSLVASDAERFQFKAGADNAGVTARLRGVEQWDPTASGKVMVWEDPQGRLFIADGHQRLGLAARLKGKGFEDVRLDGYLLRAQDGWTAGDARVIAALKNIREGSGSPLDAAKVFREAPQAINDRSLPVTGDFMGQARALARLSPEAFGAVINKVIPERWGAAIGEIAGERPDMHPALVKLLKDGEPANLDEARALVQEGMFDDFVKTEGLQTDLFGGLAPELTTIARGKIKGAVLTALKRDATVLAQLVRHADAIEAGGNVLARDGNEARLGIDRAALSLVEKLSLRSGPLGEAMAQAAREVTAGGKRPGDAAKGIVTRIRAAIAAGEAQDLMRGEVLDPLPPAPAALEDLQAFDEPAGPGQKAQAVPAPEDHALELGHQLDALPPGLFDDLPEVGPEERAHARLSACAPGE